MDGPKHATSRRRGIPRLVAVAVFLAAIAAIGACGGSSAGGDNSAAPVITMSEMRFSPNRLDLKAGQTVVVKLVNHGSQRHDLAFPSTQMPGLAGIETLTQAGETTTVTLRFDRPGTYLFQCTIEGHAAAGMTGAVYVSP
jgi:uncharacterized cupredoxin-like copper-binding protein